MSTFVSGYINDLSAVKDNIKLRVRVLRSWMQPVFSRPNISNMELIIVDEQVTQFLHVWIINIVKYIFVGKFYMLVMAEYKDASNCEAGFG